MEKKAPITSNPQGVCEKLFGALAATPAFRSFRRISHHSQDPVPPAVAPKLSPASIPPSSVDHDAKTFSAQNKHPIPEKPEQVKKSTHHTGMPGQRKVAEVIPTKADPLPPPLTTTLKEKPITPPSSLQEKSHKAKVTPASDQSLGKPKDKVDTHTQIKAVVQQGKEVAGKFKEKVEGRRDNEMAAGKVEPPEVAPTKGDHRGKAALANINEKANDYITRAKYKIRTTTTVGGGGESVTTRSK